MIEYPPLLEGRTDEQLRELRDYLVRLARELEDAAAQTTVPAAGVAVSRPQTTASSAALAPQTATPALTVPQTSALRSLIVKTAKEVTAYADELNTALESRYLALSDFGSYAETVETTIRQTARETVESYQFTSEIGSLRENLEGFDRVLTELDGRIIRGVMEDPNGNLVFGIAVAEKLTVTGETIESGGLSYRKLAAGQTLGLYTSTGWQFWIRGVKTGWFDAEDGLLHVAGLAVEQSLRFGNWLVTPTGGLGIRVL